MTGARTLAYLLRGWEERVEEDEPAGNEWRFSLEDPHTGERHGFVSLAALTAALRRRIAEEEDEG